VAGVSDLVAWCQWTNLEPPKGLRLLNPASRDIHREPVGDIDFYVPEYFTGSAGLAPVTDMRSLRVLQMPNAGYDDALPFARDGLTICNARGVHDASTAELAVGLAVASLRGLPTFIGNQDRGIWEHQRGESLADRLVGVVGYGSVGRRVGRLMAAFEATVVGFTRSGRDGSLPIGALDEHLPALDVVVLCVPAADDTRHLFDARRLALLKDGALLVNIARGSVIDTGALVRELATGRIRAALDVTDPEPLPADHPLWSFPNCLISPHVGGDSSAFEPRMKRLLAEQLQRFVTGEPLLNVVQAGKSLTGDGPDRRRA
jgi:phosphoglycerate dehydrogenase-like enzyme